MHFEQGSKCVDGLVDDSWQSTHNVVFLGYENNLTHCFIHTVMWRIGGLRPATNRVFNFVFF